MSEAPNSNHPPAKRPKSALAGPYGHPFHPILVTIPIGAWVISLVFDIASKFADESEPVLAQASNWLIGIGIIGALLAAVVGLMDFLTIPSGTKAHKTALTHMVLNVSVVVLFGIDWLLRRSDGYDEVGTGPLVLSIVALAALGASGWLGGMLSYHYGVRVADEETQAQGYR